MPSQRVLPVMFEEARHTTPQFQSVSAKNEACTLHRGTRCTLRRLHVEKTRETWNFPSTVRQNVIER